MQALWRVTQKSTRCPTLRITGLHSVTAHRQHPPCSPRASALYRHFPRFSLGSIPAAAAMLQRNRSQEALGEGYQSVSGIITYLYRLGGLTGLAARVKPSTRRSRSQSRASTGDATTGSDVPASDASSADSGSSST